MMDEAVRTLVMGGDKNCGVRVGGEILFFFSL